MKKCLIIANTFKKMASPLAKEIMAFLLDYDIVSDYFFYDGRNVQGKTLDVNFEGYDFVVTLGGDGTVLFASRGCAPLSIPIFAINLGEFGFLAAIQCDEWKRNLELFLENKCRIVNRNLVYAEVMREGNTVFRVDALNDVVISSVGSSKLVNLDVFYNHAALGSFKANGLIVASATGSTAYSAAAGGPIIDPSLKALVLTPVSSFSLSSRPLVFDGKGEIVIKVLPSRVNVGLAADGQIDFALQTNDIIILRIPEYSVQLIGSTQEKFYSALQNKLNWSGGPRA